MRSFHGPSVGFGGAGALPPGGRIAGGGSDADSDAVAYLNHPSGRLSTVRPGEVVDGVALRLVRGRMPTAFAAEGIHWTLFAIPAPDQHNYEYVPIDRIGDARYSELVASVRYWLRRPGERPSATFVGTPTESPRAVFARLLGVELDASWLIERDYLARPRIGAR